MNSTQDEVDWVYSLARRLRFGLIGARGVFDAWGLSEDLVRHQPGLAAVREALARMEETRPLVGELQQFTISIALHSVDRTIAGMVPALSGEYGQGYAHGVQACRIKLAEHLDNPPAPRPGIDDVIARLSDQSLMPPSAELVRAGVRQVLERRYDDWAPRERSFVVKQLVDYLLALETDALDNARAEVKKLRREGMELLAALRAPGDLHVTAPETVTTLSRRLSSFAAAVRTDAVLGRGFAAGFYFGCAKVTRMAGERADDMCFSREGTCSDVGP